MKEKAKNENCRRKSRGCCGAPNDVFCRQMLTKVRRLIMNSPMFCGLCFNHTWPHKLPLSI